MRASRFHRFSDSRFVVAAALAVLLLGAPANAQSIGAAAKAVDDPFVRANKAVYGFNEVLRTQVFEPAASYYRETMPVEVRAGVRNVFANLRQPVVALASGIQGDLRNAGNAAFRFILNSTLGVVGIFDVATGLGFVSRPEDFGQALCKMGIGAGPYLVLPVFGPTNMRDAAGLALTYWGTFGVLGVATTPYVAADGAAFFTREAELGTVFSDGSVSPARGSVGYDRARGDHRELRQKACDDEYIPGLDAGPLGAVFRTHLEKTPDIMN
jgi:phospholipid-binding lipoprotein MlaA